MRRHDVAAAHLKMINRGTPYHSVRYRFNGAAFFTLMWRIHALNSLFWTFQCSAIMAHSLKQPCCLMFVGF
jgi:hypothetical protein